MLGHDSLVGMILAAAFPLKFEKKEISINRWFFSLIVFWNVMGARS